MSELDERNQRNCILLLCRLYEETEGDVCDKFL
jgi:hypothetical protein